MATKMSHRECEKDREDKTKNRRKEVQEGGQMKNYTSPTAQNTSPFRLSAHPSVPVSPLSLSFTSSWGCISYPCRETTLSSLPIPLPTAFLASIFPLLTYFLHPPSSPFLYFVDQNFFTPRCHNYSITVSKSLHANCRIPKVSILRNILINVF